MSTTTFRDFFLGLDADGRKAYADRADSSVGYLTQVAYGNKRVDLGFADVLVAVAPAGVLTLESLPLSEKAAKQHQRRIGADIASESASVEPAAQGAA